FGPARGYVLYGESSYRNDYDIYSVEFDLIERKLGPMEIEEVEGLLDETKQWRETIQKDVFTLYDNGGTALATNHLQTKVQPKAKDLIERIEKLSNERERQMTAMGKQVVKYGQSSNMVGLVVTLAVFILGTIISIYTSIVIGRPVKNVATRMKAISNGELQAEPIKTKLKDEIGQLVTAVNDINDNQLGMVKQ